MIKSDIDISIIIPAKDEEKRLGRFLSQVVGFCRQSSFTYEIIVVDDGSSDKTHEVAVSLAKQYSPFHILKLKFNRGKGYAVKRGFLKASGRYVLFLDADGATQPEEIEKNLHYLDEGYDIVIGSRVLKSHTEVVKARIYRKLIGKVFNFLVRFFLFQNFYDTQCGFKMFRREVIRPIFSRMLIRGYGFDLELLYLAYKMGFNTKEVPITWVHQPGSKVNLVTDSIKMFVNILQIRNWHCTPINLYNQNIEERELHYMFAMEKYHWWFQSKNRLVKYLINSLQGEFPMILDAGCGTGLNLTYLSNHGQVYGFDAVTTALNFCCKNGLGQKLIQCSMESVAFKEQSFDLITLLDAIEHVPDPYKAMEELKFILKDDGHMIITVPAFNMLWSQHDEALCHLRRYEKKDLEEFLSDMGFEIERCGYFFFTSFFAVAPLRLIRRIFVPRGKAKSDTTTLPPRWFNAVLKAVFSLEIRVLSLFPLPFGTTLYAVIKKSSIRS